MRDFSSASAPVSSDQETHFLGLAQRIVFLAILFGSELAVITTWLDGGSLSLDRGWIGVIRDSGPLALRSIVGFAALFVTFAYLTSKPALERLSIHLASAPINWILVGAHFLAMAVFAFLSAGLYGNRFPGLSRDPLAGGWMATGVAAILLGLLAFLPLKFCVELVRQTGYSWAYALVAVLITASAENLSRSLWRPAARVTFGLVTWLLQPFVSVLVADPIARLIRTPHFRVRISPECSGLEGAGLMLAFGVTLLWLFRKEFRFPQCLILIPTGVVVLFLLNSVRIAILVLIGNAGAPEIALGGFHSQAGWIAFNFVALGFAIGTRRLPWISVRPSVPQVLERSVDNPTAAYLTPFLMILATGMCSQALSASFEWPYPLRFIAAAATLWFFRRRYLHLDWKFGWLAVATGTLVFAFWVVLDRAFNGSGAMAMPSVLAASPSPVRIAWIAIRTLAAVVTVPIAEELAFRGFLLRRLVSLDFDSVPLRGLHWLALLASSVVFGLLHGGRWVMGTAAGVSYGLIQARRGRIGDAAAAHAVSNALLAAYVLIFQQWQFW